MATSLRTAQIDTRALMKAFGELEKVFSHKFLDAKIERLAKSLLFDAINAPIPRDTGALAASGRVEKGPGKGEVTFGFDRKYASAMDLGTVKLPPKPFGSTIGPNFYFSGSLRRAAPGIYARLTALIQADLARIEKRNAKGAKK